MEWRDIPKKYRRFLIQGAVIGLVVGGGPGILGLAWLGINRLMDDGHGIYIAPSEVEPAPSPAPPWPEIAVPEGPLPRLSRSDLADYFFPPDATYPEDGQAIWRFEAETLALWDSSEKNRSADHAVLDLYAALRSKVGRLPSGYYPFDNTSPHNPAKPKAQISVYSGRKLFKAGYRQESLWTFPGRKPERIAEIGCFVRPVLSHGQTSVPPGAYALDDARIATYHRLDEPTVDHCLFKALLVALGLHPTEGFFFKEGPVTPEEQARALAALALVYHPAVHPGMTEQAFTAILLEHDLIDP